MASYKPHVGHLDNLLNTFNSLIDPKEYNKRILSSIMYPNQFITYYDLVAWAHEDWIPVLGRTLNFFASELRLGHC